MEIIHRIINFIWDWKQPIGRTIVWYGGLVYFRDELLMGEFYLLASGFWVIYLIGFSPRRPGELSAYSLFNKNHQRIMGDLDPQRAGREITGRILIDGGANQDSNLDVPYEEHELPQNNGYTLGRASINNNTTAAEDEDTDLQRALLLSLREEREARRKNH